ncbi:hypothetical protein Sjap_005234 [Stephania japonica]|uniref:Uncharacterized protein n=1 Tax=Stephania japonica TaxID=461633 RepID=A0AAP0PLN1_9MAGN
MMKWDMEMEEIEALLEKIWDIHDKLNDAIHAISNFSWEFTHWARCYMCWATEHKSWYEQKQGKKGTRLLSLRHAKPSFQINFKSSVRGNLVLEGEIRALESESEPQSIDPSIIAHKITPLSFP